MDRLVHDSESLCGYQPYCYIDHPYLAVRYYYSVCNIPMFLPEKGRGVGLQLHLLNNSW